MPGPLTTGWHRHLNTSARISQIAWNLLRGRPQADALRSFLGENKGPLMKIAQIASSIPGLLPPDYEKELAILQAHAPAMGWPFVRRRLCQELGPDWQKYFNHFDREALFAASLGQVHGALLEDGSPVACKIQYPMMEKAIEDDLKQLSLFCFAYEKYSGAVVTKNLQEEIAKHLYQEINYRQEAFFLDCFNAIFCDDPIINIPKPFHSLSTDRLLTMSFLKGRPLIEAKNLRHEERQSLSKSLFLGWYRPFYDYGLLHADPHLGNITFHDRVLNIMDFGCVREFCPQFIGAVINLYRGVQKGDCNAKKQAYEHWGFSDLDDGLIEILDLWAEFLFAPFLRDRICLLDEQNTVSKGRDLITQIHKTLKKRGGISPPREFLFMDRCAVALGAALIHLGASQNWHQLMESLIEGWTMEKVYERKLSFSNAGYLF